jgi:hypothetical protein
VRWRTGSRNNSWICFADRTSCHAWWPNQFRLLLSSLAYTLLEAIRRLALDGTELANAYVGTIRLKLLKIGAVITRNTRRIRFPAVECLSLPAVVCARCRQATANITSSLSLFIGDAAMPQGCACLDTENAHQRDSQNVQIADSYATSSALPGLRA